jgi:hypothetical protein
MFNGINVSVLYKLIDLCIVFIFSVDLLIKSYKLLNPTGTKYFIPLEVW